MHDREGWGGRGTERSRRERVRGRQCVCERREKRGRSIQTFMCTCFLRERDRQNVFVWKDRRTRKEDSDRGRESV